MEGKGSYFILLFIVALLTLTLAVLAGYLFFFAGGSSQNSAATTHTETIKAPKIEDLSNKMVFEGKRYFNLKSVDENKISVIQVTAELTYFNKIKNVETILDFYATKIEEIIGTYFQGKTLGELGLPDAKEKANKELTKEINKLLAPNEKDKKDIIYEITFGEWFRQ